LSQKFIDSFRIKMNNFFYQGANKLLQAFTFFVNHNATFKQKI